jgi:6,7-dimethyl-8-ribityllumazine synthase
MKDTMKRVPASGASRTSEHASSGCFAIVVSRYHESITSKLVEGARSTLLAAGVSEAQIIEASVPGAWEIPLAVKRLIEKPEVVAAITLGCVIRGETTHDQHINNAVSVGLMQLSLEYSKPVAFGVLTVNSLEQALDRSGGKVGNKGVEAASAALEMVEQENA